MVWQLVYELNCSHFFLWQAMAHGCSNYWLLWQVNFTITFLLSKQEAPKSRQGRFAHLLALQKKVIFVFSDVIKAPGSALIVQSSFCFHRHKQNTKWQRGAAEREKKPLKNIYTSPTPDCKPVKIFLMLHSDWNYKSSFRKFSTFWESIISHLHSCMSVYTTEKVTISCHINY